MKGYVRNKGHMWAHAMKRSVCPGGKVPLGELYEQYGKKHGLQKGREFLEWLSTVKLQDSAKWEIVLEKQEEDGGVAEVITSKSESVNIIENDQLTSEMTATSNGGESNKPPRLFDVSDIVGLTVRKARDVIPEISDKNLLKYSLQEANKLSGKDTLCMLLRRRILELD